ncbi:DUF3558 domain-containing protein [Prauserella cavernicola]|uniref:DUF3558 domain-containing protein n=1 Tax=Prauserella cavernicola TaxID=2800127 RepID=A0A934V4J5_9PSEU|nr:DUF3558 domain-containing protein [Prauserella cavernicola]MBK1784779.1 DUF3558 domain-containing protein [Prauserella cavernicola]
MSTRPSRPGRLAFGAVLAALALAGCSTPQDGEASAAGGATPEEPSPQRPAELSLDGVDPCSLFTGAQLDELKVNSEPRSSQEGRDGPTCSLDVDRTAPYYSFYVETITGADVADWVDGDRANSSTITQETEIEGFPALVHHADGSSPSDCESLVGVAQGQTLRTQLYPTDPGEFTQEQMCDLAAQAATLAVQTLQATR